ncbi:hypothetical protein [Nocardia mangyaensis]|uniref:hypothetical protein n=1 Tax=Nocardia mangyaensis TaxID=2213200 RepID=UPI0026750E4B|nr:hypothetical protein [Nocardia mangyaensis]MDO3645672.1 hypothetical protein [Nocardia mangyaensis]
MFESYLRAFQLDTTDKIAAVAKAYQVVQRHLAPFVVKVVVDMIPSLVQAVERGASKVVFLGRDGFAFGHVLSEIRPQFYAEHCVHMYVPRVLADAALQDLEQFEGKDFSPIEAFRKRSPATTEVADARENLSRYFALSGVDIEAGGRTVHLVDSGLKGSIQEMLAAAFPETSFVGHYAFFAASPNDPHPGTKYGYAMHLDGPDSRDGRALRGELPGDPTRTFQHHQAIVAIETLISGSKSSPVGFGFHGRPRVRRVRRAGLSHNELGTGDMPLEYADPHVREAILAASIMAIVHFARALAPTIRLEAQGNATLTYSESWYSHLADRSDGLRDQIREWVARTGGADADLAQLLDAFVLRPALSQIQSRRPQ